MSDNYANYFAIDSQLYLNFSTFFNLVVNMIKKPSDELNIVMTLIYHENPDCICIS